MPPALNVPPEPSNDAPLRERMRAWSSGRRMMDLVSFSEEGAIHDWNYLLGSAGMLTSDLAFARFARFIAWVVLVGSTALAARLCWWMATAKKPANG